jgi:two-component system nitrate/nitrite response regulator NarL
MTGDIHCIRVAIADARAAFRKALRTILELETDLLVVGEASDANVIPSLVRQFKPDVLIIDFLLFYDLQNRVATRPFKALVTVPTFERTDIIKAFLQGARAVVPKLSPIHVWRDSIRTVGAGRYWLVDESIAILVEALQDTFPQEAEAKRQQDYKLTPREVEIMTKIAQGHSNKEVGHAFSICERTVKHHLTSIFTKVGVSSRLELALFVLNNGLTDPAPHRKVPLADGDDPGLTRPGKRRARVTSDL